jgi:hypothetical protein
LQDSVNAVDLPFGVITSYFIGTFCHFCLVAKTLGWVESYTLSLNGHPIARFPIKNSNLFVELVALVVNWKLFDRLNRCYNACPFEYCTDYFS